MKILLATDGSPHAAVARDLVKGLVLPAESVIRVIVVLPEKVRAELADLGGDALEASLRSLREDVDTAAEPLRSGTIPVTTDALVGRPARAIVEDAALFGADLIVVGSHGRGFLTSALLGSVSAEVVDEAGCPVLVARRPAVRRVTVAEDGSPTARRAWKCLGALFAGSRLPVEVVSVSERPHLLASGVAPSMRDAVRREHAETVVRLRREHQQLAERTCAALRRRGMDATARVLEGEPAAQIIDAVRESEADLVVLGTRGRTGLARLALGSVARHVVLESPSSVLIAPRPRRSRAA